MSACAWLIDMGYVVKAARQSNLRLDYVAAQLLLSARYGMVEAFLFNSVDASLGTPIGLQKFYHAMEQQGFVVRLHPMCGDREAGTHRQRRVDVDFAAHAVWQASRPEINTLILTTGDQDMAPAFDIARDAFGVRLVLFTYLHHVSRSLTPLVDEHLKIEDFAEDLVREPSE